MGFWFFLSVIVASNMALRAYKIRLTARDRMGSSNLVSLKKEIADLRAALVKQNLDKRVEQLEEAVFFGDFELKQKFNKLESEFHNSQT